MKKGSEENRPHKNKIKTNTNNTSPLVSPNAGVKGSTTSQNSTSSGQMSGGATPVQGMNQSREKEQGDLRGRLNP